MTNHIMSALNNDAEIFACHELSLK